MRLITLLLICTSRWLSATLIYHEESVRSFHPGIVKTEHSFGYSITFTTEGQRLIVGAPKTSDVGALFTCDIETRNCSQFPTNITAPRGFKIWLGASVTAGYDFFATCAPRFFDDERGGYVFSRCYKYQPRRGFNHLELMRDKEIKKQQIEHRMLTLGWSMDVAESDVLAGGPAMFRGYAAMYKWSANEVAEYPSEVISTDKVSTNFGYCILHRKYRGKTEYIISSTYGEHGFGLVLLLKQFTTFNPITTIKGKQVGSMFGASLCAASVGDNSQSILLVGAPTHAHNQMYNAGAVFVYINHNNNTYREVLGTRINGQFGYAIANLGDLNGDRIDEIAISAPFEGSGVVYIYSGSHLLDRDKPVQHLQRIQRAEHHHFGFSLHALPDYNWKGCKDLAIGAPQSDSVVLIQCIPRMTIFVQDLSKIYVKSNITARKTSIQFLSCLDFEFPELPKEINEEFLVKVDIINLKIEESENIKNNTITYTFNLKFKDRSRRLLTSCKNITVNTEIDALYDPTMHYKVSASLKDDPNKMASFSPSRVTTSDRSVLVRPGVAWVGECEQKDKCKPKLKMTTQSSINSWEYVVGSNNEETIRISVRNEGDPAYKTCIKMELYNITVQSIPKYCMLSSKEGILYCNPISLLRNGTTWDTNEIKVDTRSIVSSSDIGILEYMVSVQLFDDCKAGSCVDKWYKKIPLRRDVENVTVSGSKEGDDVINITRNEIETSSKQIQHKYIIHNNGVTTWTNLRFTISLKKEFYLDGISKISDQGYECLYEETNDKDYYISYCKITTALKKDKKLEIVLPIDIMPIIYETLKKRQLKVTSSLKLYIDGQEKYYSVVSTLRFFEFKVETWILVIAILFSMAIIIIAALILYEFGFLTRKKKEDLRELRKSIVRQSMRRSALIQRNQDNTDQENLIAEDCTPEEDSIKPEVTEENLKKPGEIVNETKDNCLPDEEKIQDVKDAKAKTVKAKDKDSNPIGNIIIGGLQKNIGRREVQPRPTENKSTK